MPLPIGTLSFLPRHTDSQTPGPSWNTDTGHRLQADRHHLCGPVLPQSATALGRHTFQCPARPSRSASRQPRRQRSISVPGPPFSAVPSNAASPRPRAAAGIASLLASPNLMICAAPREPPPSRERGGGASLEQPSPCPGRSPRPLADLTARRRPLVVAGGPPPGIGALFASPTRSSRYLLRVHRVTEPYSENYCKSYEIKTSQFFPGTPSPSSVGLRPGAAARPGRAQRADPPTG